jgi:diguanylate cyclase (GGDEF)-like protein
MQMRSKLAAATKDGAILTAVLAVLIGGTWAISEVTVHRLLYNDAISTGQTWASYLANNVEDIEDIAGGKKPSPESQRFFDRVRQVGQVFRYIVYDPQGHTRLISDTLDADDDDDEDLAKHNPEAAKSIADGHPLINVEDGEPPTRPPFFAEAYVPVMAKGKTVAIVEVYVDQTTKRNDYQRTFLGATAALGLLIVLGFGVPAIAWRRGAGKRRLADEHIRFLADHDPLTSLPNRSQLISRIDAAFAGRRQGGERLAMHSVNIDRFKDVNESLGHSAGDSLIVAIAERLRTIAPVGGTTARSGGDEFVVLQTNVVGPDDALSLSRAISAALSRSYVIGGQTISITISIGVAITSTDTADAARLMKSADLALDRAKTAGGDAIRLYSSDMDEELARRLRLEKTIREAAANDRFELNFQPVIKVPERRLIGFEALLRLRDDQGAPIPPMTFIPIAEQIGLISAIGAWVLREACKTAATWPEDLAVAVNLSPAQFREGNLSTIVAAVLAESGLEPRRLELEITEGLLLGDSEAVLNQLGRLKQLGVAIVMDDFGTGYSSLSYLWKFPFNKLKIDRAFMLAIEADAPGNAETIVKTIIDLGRSLHMAVTIEGVESDRQARFVQAAGGDQIQGYYFSKPLPASELASYILSGLHQGIRPAATSTKRAARLKNVG